MTAPSDIMMSPTQIHLGLLSLHRYPTTMQENPNETLNVRLSAPICVLVMVNCRSMELGATNVIDVETKLPTRVDVSAKTMNHRRVLKYRRNCLENLPNPNPEGGVDGLFVSVSSDDPVLAICSPCWVVGDSNSIVTLSGLFLCEPSQRELEIKWNDD